MQSPNSDGMVREVDGVTQTLVGPGLHDYAKQLCNMNFNGLSHSVLLMKFPYLTQFDHWWTKVVSP